MRKTVILLMLCLGLLAGCGSNASPADSSNPPVPDNDQAVDEVLPDNSNHQGVPAEFTSGDVIEIREKMFIAQTNDIYYNQEDYLGKTIKYEGIFEIYDIDGYERPFYAVIRYGPGCCGIDLNAGFEVLWDKEYPNKNDWVEVVGVLEEYEDEDDGNMYLRVALTSLNVLPTRGEEYVSQ